MPEPSRFASWSTRISMARRCAATRSRNWAPMLRRNWSSPVQPMTTSKRSRLLRRR